MTIQQVASYWDGRPCNIRHSNKPVGTSEYFEEVSKRKYHVEPHILEFADFNSWKGKRVLEIGCGIGTAMQSFSEAGAFYTGIDLSSKSIEIARQRVQVFDLKNVELHVANVENLDKEIPITQYDLIYSFGVLHHTPSEEHSFTNLRHFAKSGTKIKIMVYHKFSTKAIYLWIRYGWRTRFSLNKAVALQSEAEFGCPVTRTYRKSDARKIARYTGFKPKKVKIDHIFPYAIRPYVRYQYKLRNYWKIFPKEIFIGLESFFGWHLLIEGEFD